MLRHGDFKKNTLPRKTWKLRQHVIKTCSYGAKRGGAGNGLWSWSWSSMIAPVKKSVNQSRTVASVRETGWEQQQEIRLRRDSTVWSEFSFGPVGHCFLCCNQFLSAVMWSLRFPFFWSCVCHYMRFTTLRTRPVNIDRKQTLFLDARPFDSLHLSRCRLSSCVSV